MDGELLSSITGDGRVLIFLVLSGLATGASLLCCYRALQTGTASIVVSIDKLSILVTIKTLKCDKKRKTDS